MNKPTIYDVAKLAGVSTATVSKVFNQTGRISAETKQKIAEASKKLDYQPSVVASALTGKKTFSIGLLIPDLANPFFAELSRSVEDRAHDLGFNVMICNTDNDKQKELKYIELLRRKSVDGIIVATGAKNNELLQELIDQNVSIALIAREISLLSASTVLVDDFAGGYNATSHLIQLGHTKIGIITEKMNVKSSEERLRGYRYALDESGLKYDKKLIEVSDFSVEGGRKSCTKLLSKPNPPSAIFACNDLLAIGAMQAAKAQNLTIPTQLSIVGFDNTILAEITDPPLTTIAQPIQDMGHQVVDLITQEINDKKSIKQRTVLLPELIIRNSTTKWVEPT